MNLKPIQTIKGREAGYTLNTLPACCGANTDRQPSTHRFLDCGKEARDLNSGNSNNHHCTALKFIFVIFVGTKNLGSAKLTKATT